MELQHQVKSERSRNIYNQPAKFDANAHHHLFSAEPKSNFVRLEGNSDSYCSIWMDAEPARVNSGESPSFAADTRKRLDNFNFGSNSHLPCCDMDGTVNTKWQKELWDKESREEQSALDLVELLDVEDDVQDEESWLYESPKKQDFVEESNKSALKWCRQVLDNPSPETEVACRVLRNMLDQRSRSFLGSHSFRRPVVFHETGYTCLDSTGDQRPANTTHSTSDSLDYNEPSVSRDSITMDYRLQDLTDVHIMARIQEDSLRQDYVSTPASPASPGSSMLLSSNFNNTSTSQSSSPCQSPTSSAQQSCHSPQLSRFHHQVTQFKLLKLAQNRAAASMSSRSSPPSPLRTSLRSLQAVRDSRSVEGKDHISPLSYPVALRPPAGVSPARMGKSCWSSSLSAAYMSPSGSSAGSQSSLRDSSVQTTAVKRPQRSLSLSPSGSRIPHPAKGFSAGGYLSGHGRVFASPERAAMLAWGGNVPPTRR
ncbi:SLAIN motif-containing protein-like isoform X1 [Centroberyx gerrardi]